MAVDVDVVVVRCGDDGSCWGCSGVVRVVVVGCGCDIRAGVVAGVRCSTCG